MKTLTKKEMEVVYLERKAAIIANEAPKDISNIFTDIIPLIKHLRTYERKLQKLAELDCNGYPKLVTEYRDGKMYRYNVEDELLKASCEKAENTLRTKVVDIAERFNLKVKFQGDTRGYMFSLETPSGKEVTL